VFIHSRGARLFLGPASERNEREVTAEEVEALASAGFEIIQVDMREGAPLCAALAGLPAAGAFLDLTAWLPQAVWTYLEP
jgi:hypothetical protein